MELTSANKGVHANQFAMAECAAPSLQERPWEHSKEYAESLLGLLIPVMCNEDLIQMKRSRKATAKKDAYPRWAKACEQIFPQIAHFGPISLPSPSFASYPYVTELIILDNNVFPGILYGATSLRKLQLFDNLVDRFPTEIALCVELQAISIKKCPNIRHIPHQISLLTHLTEMYFEDSPIQSIPESISALLSMVILKAIGLALSKIPSDIGCLVKLEHLDLSDNKISRLPLSVSQLTALTHLNIMDNPFNAEGFDYLSTLVNLKSFQSSIDFSSHWSDVLLEAFLMKEASVELSHNTLKFLEAAPLDKYIPLMRFVENINVHSNESDKLVWISHLSSLKSITFNKQSVLPDFLGALTSLSSISVTVGNVEHIPDSIFTLPAIQSIIVDQKLLNTNLAWKVNFVNDARRSFVVYSDAVDQFARNITSLQGLKGLELSYESTPVPNASFLNKLRASNPAHSDINRVILPMLSRFSMMESVSIPGCKLPDIPNQLSMLSKLTSMSFHMNDISAIPDWLAKNQKIASLDFRDNQIYQVPDVSEALNLKTLLLNENPIEYIHPSVFKSGLIVLQLSSSVAAPSKPNITAYEKAFTLKNQYDLTDCKTVAIAEQIIRAIQPEKINLSKRYIDVFPVGITASTGLKELNLSGNLITVFPKEICILSNLAVLNLSRNKIRQIPSSIHLLSNVTNLDLSNNSIEEMPHEMHPITSLQTVNLSGNRIRTIRGMELNFPKVIHMNLSSNKIQVVSISRGFPSVELLDLSLNIIDSLGDIDFGGQLRSLNISHNQLTSLPDWLLQHTRISSLSILKNNLPPGSEDFISLPNLCEFEFSSIYFEADSRWKEEKGFIKQLSLRDKDLFELPDLSKFFRIVDLDLSSNNLTCVSKLTFLNKLQSLNVTDNLLTTLPMCFSTLTQLTRICAKDNAIRIYPVVLDTMHLMHIEIDFVEIPSNYTFIPSDSGFVKISSNLGNVDVSRMILWTPTYAGPLCHFANLESIDISDSNAVFIPKYFRECTKLVLLTVSNHNIYFTKDWYMLPNLFITFKNDTQIPFGLVYHILDKITFYDSTRCTTNDLSIIPNNPFFLGPIKKLSITDSKSITNGIIFQHMTSLEELRIESLSGVARPLKLPPGPITASTICIVKVSLSRFSAINFPNAKELHLSGSNIQFLPDIFA